MADVQYEEPNIGIVPLPNRGFAPRGLIGFLVKKGWAKDKERANMILIGITILCIAITVFTISQMFGGSLPKKYTPNPNALPLTPQTSKVK